MRREGLKGWALVLLVMLAACGRHDKAPAAAASTWTSDAPEESADSATPEAYVPLYPGATLVDKSEVAAKLPHEADVERQYTTSDNIGQVVAYFASQCAPTAQKFSHVAESRGFVSCRDREQGRAFTVVALKGTQGTTLRVLARQADSGASLVAN